MKTIRVGRSSGNDIVIQHDPYVGRTHCQFIIDDNGNYRVIDLNSANGTYINGVRRQGETKLNVNDTVRIGNTILPWQNYFNGKPGGTVVDGGDTKVGPYIPYTPPTPPEPPKQGKGMAITSMVCGIVGFFFLGLVLGIMAIIFGGVALSRNTKGKGMAVTGLVLGIIEVIANIVLWLVVGSMGLDILSALG